MLILVGFTGGCDGGNEKSVKAKIPFILHFKAKSNDKVINCHDHYNGFGSDQKTSIGVGDLRFFVSNLRFYTDSGESIAVKLDSNDFQYSDEKGSVSLIDFLGSETDFCGSVAEATPRINTQITGAVSDIDINRVSFDVGVPQALMKTMIAAGPVEDAPSPLNELYWSWAGGYRHFVVNFTVMDLEHNAMVNNGAFHIGSMDCGGDMSTGANALTTRESCGRINTPSVVLENFNPATNTIVVDISKAFSGIKETDVKRAIWQEHKGDEGICMNDRRKNGRCITGQIFGMQCHSRSAQAACQTLFPNFGIDISSGDSQSTSNTVFTME